MALDTNQAEISQQEVGHRYGDVHVYGNAILGDGSMNITQAPRDAEEQKRMILIDALDYANSGAKRDQLKLTEIGPTSFAWVKETQLSQWLQHGTTPFWISGKPGSGKSTLVRYLVDSKSTQELLNSDGRRWTILHFFYDYRAGSGTANNPIGMPRHFLLQLVRFIPSASEHVDHRQVQQQLMQEDIDDFLDILVYAVRSTDVRICAFVDGLDEYDGHLWELCSYLEILRDRTGMKMCLASRPEPELVHAFNDFPTIAMQDHNDSSIQNYIERRLLQCSSLHPNIRSIFTNKVSKPLRQKAQGVILWAKLVVDEMLEAYDHATTEQSLVDLLASFPQELAQLYDRLIDNLPDAFRGDAIFVLNLVANWNAGTALDADVLIQGVSFVFGLSFQQLFFGESAECGTIELHIKNSLGRLLDFMNKGVEGQVLSHVRLIHETLATHLRRSAKYHELLPDCAKQYHGSSAWAMLTLDIFQRAKKDDALDVSTLSSELQDVLQARLRLYMQGVSIGPRRLVLELRGLPLPIEAVTFEKLVQRPDWTRLARLLYCCWHFCNDLLMVNPGLVGDRLDTLQSCLSSDAMVLHLLTCAQCSAFTYYLGPQTAKILRVWERGRLDLVCAAIHRATTYLSEVFSPAELESIHSAAVFGLLVLSVSIGPSAEEMHHFRERWMSQGGSVGGRWICAITSDAGPHRMHSAFRATEYMLDYSFSKAHDEDCRYYGTTHTVMMHWVENDFKRSSMVFATWILRLITQAGVDINAPCNQKGSAMETILDLSSASLKGDQSFEFVSSIAEKLIVLLEEGAGLPSFNANLKSLNRVIKLRRKLSVYNHTLGRFRGNFDPRVMEVLEIMVRSLKQLKATGTVPEADIEALRRVVQR